MNLRFEVYLPPMPFASYTILFTRISLVATYTNDALSFPLAGQFDISLPYCTVYPIDSSPTAALNAF